MSNYAVMPLTDYVNTCDAIREKTGSANAIKSDELPERVSDVFKAGQLDIVSNAEALKGSASGTNIIALTDISPVKHNVLVKLSGMPPTEEAGSTITLPTPYAFEDDEAQTGMTWTVADDGTITIDVDGTATAGTNPWFIVENLVLPAGEYVLSGLESVTATAFEEPNWSHYIRIAKSDLYSGYADWDNDILGTWDITKFSSSITPTSIAFTLTEETPIWIDYMYGSANIGMSYVPDRVVTVIKPVLMQNVTYIPYDYSSVTLKRLGKNLFNGELTIWRNADRIMPKECIKVKRNTWYKIMPFDYTITKPTFACYGNNTGVIADGTDKSIPSNNYWNYYTGDYDYIWFRQWNSMTEAGISLESRIQIAEVEGETSPDTEFEPYIEPVEYTANADGTVEGVTSLYPTTTLIPDTEGVTITAEYIKDIDKAFQAVTTAVALTGGE